MFNVLTYKTKLHRLSIGTIWLTTQITKR